MYELCGLEPPEEPVIEEEEEVEELLDEVEVPDIEKPEETEELVFHEQWLKNNPPYLDPEPPSFILV